MGGGGGGRTRRRVTNLQRHDDKTRPFSRGTNRVFATHTQRSEATLVHNRALLTPIHIYISYRRIIPVSFSREQSCAPWSRGPWQGLRSEFARKSLLRTRVPALTAATAERGSSAAESTPSPAELLALPVAKKNIYRGGGWGGRVVGKSYETFFFVRCLELPRFLAMFSFFGNCLFDKTLIFFLRSELIY